MKYKQTALEKKNFQIGITLGIMIGIVLTVVVIMGAAYWKGLVPTNIIQNTIRK